MIDKETKENLAPEARQDKIRAIFRELSRNPDKGAIRQLKKAYPEEETFIKSLGENIRTIGQIVEINFKTINRKPNQEELKGLVQWQHRAQELLWQGDKEFAQLFWQNWKESYLSHMFGKQFGHPRRKEMLKKMEEIQRGVIGEMGGQKILEKSGYSIQPSTAQEDIDEYTDFYANKDKKTMLVQVKTSKSGENLLLISSQEELKKLPPELKEKYQEIFNQLERVVFEKRSKIKEKKFIPLVMVIPEKELDSYTGKPSQKLIQVSTNYKFLQIYK